MKGPRGYASVTQPDRSNTEWPPAIFYGEVKSGSTFTAQPGIVVTAKMMGGTICGQAKTIEVDGSVKYVIDVRAVAKDGEVTCGQTGGVIAFAVDDQVILPAATWDNSHMQQLDLSPAP